jgi:DNA polymerase-3 subunit delta'
MNAWKTAGHDRVKRILDRQLQAGSFAHAYAIIGSPKIGKRTLAMEFAAKLLNVDSLQNHPDFAFVDASDFGGVAQVRELVVDRLSVKPFIGSRTVVVIDNAQDLTVEAMNALLKTLEEPPAHATLLLISSGELMPTITSRCFMLSCYGTTIAELREQASRMSLPANEDAATLASGAIGRFVELSSDTEKTIELSSVISRMLAAMNGSRTQKLLAVTSFAEHETNDLSEWLTILLNSHKSDLSLQQMHTIIEAITQLKKTINKKHALALAFGAYV